jgi:hypothetical protein
LASALARDAAGLFEQVAVAVGPVAPASDGVAVRGVEAGGEGGGGDLVEVNGVEAVGFVHAVYEGGDAVLPEGGGAHGEKAAGAIAVIAHLVAAGFIDGGMGRVRLGRSPADS